MFKGSKSTNNKNITYPNKLLPLFVFTNRQKEGLKKHKRGKKLFKNINQQIRKKDCSPFQIVALESDSEPLLYVHPGLKNVNPYD